MRKVVRFVWNILYNCNGHWNSFISCLLYAGFSISFFLFVVTYNESMLGTSDTVKDLFFSTFDLIQFDQLMLSPIDT